MNAFVFIIITLSFAYVFPCEVYWKKVKGWYGKITGKTNVENDSDQNTDPEDPDKPIPDSVVDPKVQQQTVPKPGTPSGPPQNSPGYPSGTGTPSGPQNPPGYPSGTGAVPASNTKISQPQPSHGKKWPFTKFDPKIPQMIEPIADNMTFKAGRVRFAWTNNLGANKYLIEETRPCEHEFYQKAKMSRYEVPCNRKQLNNELICELILDMPIPGLHSVLMSPMNDKTGDHSDWIGRDLFIVQREKLSKPVIRALQNPVIMSKGETEKNAIEFLDWDKVEGAWNYTLKIDYKPPKRPLIDVHIRNQPYSKEKNVPLKGNFMIKLKEGNFTFSIKAMGIAGDKCDSGQIIESEWSDPVVVIVKLK